jgi:hypothetical protein
VSANLELFFVISYRTDLVNMLHGEGRISVLPGNTYVQHYRHITGGNELLNQCHKTKGEEIHPSVPHSTGLLLMSKMYNSVVSNC